MKLIPQGGNKKGILGGTIIAVVIIAAVAALIFWFRPATIVGGAIERLGQADSQRFDAVVIISNDQTTQQILGEEATLELAFNGVFKREADTKDSLTADFSVTAQTESLTMLIEGEVRFIGDQAYLLIKKTPPAFPPLVAIKDQWIELPRGGVDTASQLPTNDTDFFTNIERADRRQIADQQIRTYNLTATPTAVLLMMDSVADVLGTRLTAEQIANFRQGVTNVESLPVTVGVTPLARDLRYLATTLSLPTGNTVSIETTFTDRNKTVEISPPEGALTLQELAATVPAPQ